MDSGLFSFKVGHVESVDVTHINDPHSFYVRPVIDEKYLSLIEKPGPDPISANCIKLGKRVVYKSTVLGKYVRGEIRFIGIDGQSVKCDILAIDYGCFDKSVLLKHIRNPEITAQPENQCPGMAVHCRLNLCEPKGETFTKEAIDTMKFYVGEYTASITIKSKMIDQLVVELHTVNCPQDIATMMGLLHLTTFLKGPNTVNRFYNSSSSPYIKLTQVLNYKHKKLNVGDILHVRVQSGTSVSGFYVAEINEFKELISSEPAFSQYCKSRPIKDKDIVPGTPCAVKLDNLDKYERAIIKKIIEPKNSRAVLQLVDWGKEIESHYSCMRSVASEIYFTKPIIAIYCSTDEAQVWPTSLPTFLFQGYQLAIKIMQLGNGFVTPHKVNIYPVKYFI